MIYHDGGNVLIDCMNNVNCVSVVNSQHGIPLTVKPTNIIIELLAPHVSSIAQLAEQVEHYE